MKEKPRKIYNEGSLKDSLMKYSKDRMSWDEGYREEVVKALMLKREEKKNTSKANK